MPGNRVVVVNAVRHARRLYRGPRAASGPRCSACVRVAVGATSSAGVALGAGLLGGRDGRMVVLRPRDGAARDHGGAGSGEHAVVGSPTADQGIFARGSRCGSGRRVRRDPCDVRNGDSRRHVDRYVAHVNGSPC